MIQGLKLSDMRSNRELNEVKEKNSYLARLLRSSKETVKRLEEKVAEIESKMHKEAEKFR